MMRVVNLWKKLNCVGVCRKNYYDRASSSVEDQMVIMMTTDAASDLTSLGTSFVTSLTSFVTSLSSSVTQQPSSSSSTGFYFQRAAVAVVSPFHPPPHRVDVATLPCESRNTENVNITAGYLLPQKTKLHRMT